MKELIDVSDHIKMMALILGGFRYDNQEYLLYAIHRNEQEVNIFVSKLVMTSNGYKITHDFFNGEKEVLSNVVQRFLSKDDIIHLEQDGYTLFSNVELEGINYFDVDLCYVATVPKGLIKDCLIHYGLSDDGIFNSPVVSVVEDKKSFNAGFVENVFLVIFGILVLIFSISMIGFIFFK